MEMVISRGFSEISDEETMLIEGGGNLALFFSCLGIAASPVIMCLNPVAGIGLLATSITVFGKNM